MKKTLTLLLALTCFKTFSSDIHESKVFIVSEKKIESTIELNTKTLRCSNVGYSAPELKVSVPDLEWAALFDHSNFGEVLPCMSAGFCALFPPVGNTASSVISRMLDLNKPFEKIEISIILSEEYTLNHKRKTCFRGLNEDLETNIRGTIFTHHRSMPFGDYPYELCVQLPSNS
jgi:hypothetical protein